MKKFIIFLVGIIILTTKAISSEADSVIAYKENKYIEIVFGIGFLLFLMFITKIVIEIKKARKK